MKYVVGGVSVTDRFSETGQWVIIGAKAVAKPPTKTRIIT
jgi:hypothetical protein